jgi:hypothetical protein
MGTSAAVALGVLAWAVFRLDETPKAAPDSGYYGSMPFTKVPAPFSFRPLVPLLAGGQGSTWVFLTFLGIVMQSVAMFWLTGSLAGSVLILGLPAGARFSVRHPVLVDAYALGCTLMAAAVGWSVWGLVLLVPMLALMREQAPVLLALLTGHPWLGLGVLLAPASHAAVGRETDPARDNAFITYPWRTVQAYRKGHWLSFGHMVLPWGMVLPLAMLTPWTWPMWVALALGIVPVLRASDVGRVAMWGAPVLILAAVQAPIPPTAWPLVLLIHCLNPYRGG